MIVDIHFLKASDIKYCLQYVVIFCDIAYAILLTCENVCDIALILHSGDNIAILPQV